MTIDKICQYIFHTPENINKAILIQMLEQLVDEAGGPDVPDGEVVIYDGGEEV